MYQFRLFHSLTCDAQFLYIVLATTDLKASHDSPPNDLSKAAFTVNSLRMSDMIWCFLKVAQSNKTLYVNICSKYWVLQSKHVKSYRFLVAIFIGRVYTIQCKLTIFNFKLKAVLSLKT